MKIANLKLLPHTLEHLRALVEGSDAYERRFGLPVADGVGGFLAGPEVSEAFLERLRASTEDDPWKDGFGVVHVADNLLIGLCSFGGPPSRQGTVEISYGIAPSYRERGFATEATRLIVARAFEDERVRAVQAHTLPERNASTKVLEKCGFTLQGELMHPEDGLIWRWELQRQRPNQAMQGTAGRSDV
ncbi:MAG: [ribosomal protein S5]-alanine N-acetyltransferase [Verrucomicrobiota bacterium]